MLLFGVWSVRGPLGRACRTGRVPRPERVTERGLDDLEEKANASSPALTHPTSAPHVHNRMRADLDCAQHTMRKQRGVSPAKVLLRCASCPHTRLHR